MGLVKERMEVKELEMSKQVYIAPKVSAAKESIKMGYTLRRKWYKRDFLKM